MAPIRKKYKRGNAYRSNDLAKLQASARKSKPKPYIRGQGHSLGALATKMVRKTPNDEYTLDADQDSNAGLEANELAEEDRLGNPDIAEDDDAIEEGVEEEYDEVTGEVKRVQGNKTTAQVKTDVRMDVEWANNMLRSEQKFMALMHRLLVDGLGERHIHESQLDCIPAEPDSGARYAIEEVKEGHGSMIIGDDGWVQELGRDGKVCRVYKIRGMCKGQPIITGATKAEVKEYNKRYNTAAEKE